MNDENKKLEDFDDWDQLEGQDENLAQEKPRSPFQFADAPKSALNWIRKATGSGVKVVAEVTGIGSLPKVEDPELRSRLTQTDDDDDNYTPFVDDEFAPLEATNAYNPTYTNEEAKAYNQGIRRNPQPESPQFEESSSGFTGLNRHLNKFSKQAQKEQEERMRQRIRRQQRQSGFGGWFKLLFLAAIITGGYYGYKNGKSWFLSSNNRVVKIVRDKFQIQHTPAPKQKRNTSRSRSK